jgi:hypothetical protein
MASSSGAGSILNIKIGGVGAEMNNTSGNWNNTNRGPRVSRGSNTILCISGYNPATNYGGGGNNSTNVGDYLTTQNTGNAGSATQSLADAPNSFSGPGCPTPLLFASGGIKCIRKIKFNDNSTLINYFLRNQQLNSIVKEAIHIWELFGLSKPQIERLQNTEFEVGSLKPGQLGNDNMLGVIIISSDADGKGWYMGTDKDSYAQFNHVHHSGRMLSSPNMLPAGHLDLLTCILHEMGHILGLKDLDGKLFRKNIMYCKLLEGERRLPIKETVKKPTGK